MRWWEAELGRPAPVPVEPGRHGQPRLAPRFAEWLMGLPAGWVTDLPLPHGAQLALLGNGVVPAQAAAALRRLAAHLPAHAVAALAPPADTTAAASDRAA